MTHTHPIGPSVQAYLCSYLPAVKGVSAHTILAYRDTIKLLVCFAADCMKTSPDSLNVEDLDEPCVLNFLNHLETSRDNCARTRNARLAGICSLFDFIGRENPELLEHCRRIRLIPFKRTDHKAMNYLNAGEMKALIDAADTNSRRGIRDRALLLILYNTGARVSEVADLTFDDLKLDSPCQVKMLGKGRKQRACPLWPEVVAAIEKYIEIRLSRDPGERRLFLNVNGRPITRFGIRYIVQQYAQAASLQCPSLKSKAIGPHTLRHSTAMHLIQAGNDINMVKLWLGHANLNTTHAYADIDMEMKRKILNSTIPPASGDNGDGQPRWQKPQILEWLDSLSKRVSIR
ncbi:MAG: site-specific integrase [Phycisphaerae bacterium]|nr:site-specific integrase [Phycisphaerae bacterium]